MWYKITIIVFMTGLLINDLIYTFKKTDQLTTQKTKVTFT